MDLKKLKEVGDKATHGPWDCVLPKSPQLDQKHDIGIKAKTIDGWKVIAETFGQVSSYEKQVQSGENAQFISEARKNWNALIQLAQEGIDAKEKLKEVRSASAAYAAAASAAAASASASAAAYASAADRKRWRIAQADKLLELLKEA